MKITFKSFMDNIFIPIAFFIGTFMSNESNSWIASGDYNIYIRWGIRVFALYLLVSGMVNIMKGDKK